MKLKDKLVARMVELAQDGGTWTVVPSYSPTLRFTRTEEVHPANRGEGFGRWPKPTYERHLFVSLAGDSFIVGDGRAPWMGRQDSAEPLWFVEMLLAATDPFEVLDQRLALKQARKAARS